MRPRAVTAAPRWSRRRSFRERALLLPLVTLLGVGGCPRRKPLPLAKSDMGPAVEVVQAPTSPAQRSAPALPLGKEEEPNDTLATAQPLTMGGGIRGTLAEPHSTRGKLVGDVDLYSFMAPGAPSDMGSFAEVRLELTGVPGLALSLEVLDGDGKRLLVRRGGVGAPIAIPNVAVEPAHTYYVRVREAKSPLGAKDQPYALTLQSAPAGSGEEREPNDTAAQASSIALTNGQSGQAQGLFGGARDEDWLQLSLDGLPAPAAWLRLELVPPAGVTVSIKVEDAKGQRLATTRGLRDAELRLRNVGLDPASGPVRIALLGLGGGPEARWVLRYAVEPPLNGVEREPNDDPARATPLVLANGAGSLAGFLWPGDRDCYRVSGAPAEAQLRFEVDGVEDVDLTLERVDSAGKVLSRADDNRVGQGEVLPPALWGDGLVRVSARVRDTAFDVPYHLTATVVPAAPDEEREPNDTAATATPFVGTSMRGRLAPRGDEDWYAVTGTGVALTPRVDGPIPASARLVDGQRHSVVPGMALAEGQRYYLIVKAVSGRASNPNDLYTVTLSP